VPHLLPEIDEERARVITRETFLVSVVLHIAVVIFVLANPDLIHLGSPEVVLPPPQEQEVTMLYEPPPPRPQLQAPPEPAPPAPPPQLPRSVGVPDSQIEEPRPLPRGQPDQPVRPDPPPEPRGQGDDEEELLARRDPVGTPDIPERSAEPSRRQPSFEEIPKEEPPPAQARLPLPTINPPSRGTDAILREMARQHAEGGTSGSNMGSFGVPDAGDPNFNLPGPQILSDTMGVNFDPYLLRVYLSVQRNWYSVIPEIARLGRRGRVILQFRILKNGAVADLQLMDGSGTGSMDSAALSSIRLSNPFPPLPPEFPGQEIVLRFGYYYNMQPEYPSNR
jgi:TonB family protein